MFHTAGMRALAMLDRRILWRIPGSGKEVYLTFDDGPTPEATPWVVDTLAKHGARATFFCLGRNAERHPELVDRLRSEGHAIGHHTWDHPDGWRTSPKSYYRNVLHGHRQTGGILFRPPYGRVPIGQLRRLGRHFRVVMWDVLSGDFHSGAAGETCVKRVLARTRPGSIIVFHDNVQRLRCLRDTLPVVL
mgnify:FL=1